MGLTLKKSTFCSQIALKLSPLPPQKDVFLYKINTGRFIMFSVTTNIYKKKTKGSTLMEFFTATGKLKKGFFC
jgi:hypothetical protein